MSTGGVIAPKTPEWVACQFDLYAASAESPEAKEALEFAAKFLRDALQLQTPKKP